MIRQQDRLYFSAAFMQTSFRLLEQGLFEDACITADQEYLQTKEHFALRHKCFALFHLKRYSEVISICEQILQETNWRHDSDAICLGVASWMTGNSIKAFATLMTAKDCPYSDAAGGVEYLAIAYSLAIVDNNAEILGKTLRMLKRKPKSRSAMGWPMPIAMLIAGLIQESDLLGAVATQPYLHEKQLCQASFYTAIVRKRNGDEDGFNKYLQLAIAQRPAAYLKVEYYLADFLLNHSRVGQVRYSVPDTH